MIQTIRNLFKRKESATNRAIVAYLTGGGKAVWTPANYEQLAQEGYARNVYVHRCVDYVATAVAGVEWCLYQNSRSGKESTEIEDPNHPLLKLWNRPNPLMTGTEFRSRLVAHRLLQGNAYVERVGPKSRPPLELYAHRPDRMRVIVGDSVNPIAGYKYSVNGIDTDFKPEQICHWKTFHPLNDWYGMSPLEAAAQSVDQNNESRSWNVALLQNSARPPGGFFSKEPLSDEQFSRLQSLVEDRYSGSSNAGRPILGEGGIEWQDFGLSPIDMAWVEGTRMSNREICTAFGVPPELIGDPTSKTYSNYQEARQAFYQETVLPLLDSLRDALNAWLVPLFGDNIRLEYDADDIEALQEDQDAIFTRLEKCTFLTVNEKRERAGYEALPDPEADKVYVSTQVIPLDAVSMFQQTTDAGDPLPTAADATGKAWDRVIEAQKAGVIGLDEAREMIGFPASE